MRVMLRGLLCLAVLCCSTVDQRTESSGRVGGRVAVNCMAQDPINQQYIATGGGDTLGRCAQLSVVPSRCCISLLCAASCSALQYPCVML
jgi:hypothetical protein